MRKRFQTLKEDQKGFTLVELIVVLVILAIMAALLAPALLGYIDKARYSKYLEECRSISTAMQAVNDELYAKGKDPIDKDSFVSGKSKFDEVTKLIYPTVLTEAKYTPKNGLNTKDKYIIEDITYLKFTSQDGSTVEAKQIDGDWEVTDVKAKAASTGGSGGSSTSNSETGNN